MWTVDIRKRNDIILLMPNSTEPWSVGSGHCTSPNEDLEEAYWRTPLMGNDDKLKAKDGCPAESLLEAMPSCRAETKSKRTPSKRGGGGS